MLNHNGPMVEAQIQIGGDLPESKLPPLLYAIIDLHDPFLEKTKKYRNSIEASILNRINVLNDSPLIFDVEAPDGNIDAAFFIRCTMENLNTLIRMAPFVDHNGLYINEEVWLTPGTSDISKIPTDGDMNPTILVKDVQIILNEIISAYEQTISIAPLDINTPGVFGDVARRKLAGESLQKILIEVMNSNMSSLDMVVPPFRVIKGK